VLGSTGPERRRGGSHGRPGRVDVVDEHHASRHAPGRCERTADVSPALDERQPGLLCNCSCAPEQRTLLELPASSEFAREPSRRVVAPLETGSPSGGIYVMTSATGGGTAATTSSAARVASGRSPRSFHARTSTRVDPV
jgi:hypothetical protein